MSPRSAPITRTSPRPKMANHSAPSGYKELTIEHVLGRVLILNSPVAKHARTNGGHFCTIRWRALRYDAKTETLSLISVHGEHTSDCHWPTIQEAIREGLMYVD